MIFLEIWRIDITSRRMSQRIVFRLAVAVKKIQFSCVGFLKWKVISPQRIRVLIANQE